MKLQFLEISDIEAYPDPILCWIRQVCRFQKNVKWLAVIIDLSVMLVEV